MMKFILLIPLLSALAPAALSAGLCDDTTARIDQGVAHGIRLNNGVNAFLGIPYARPPVGHLRFQPPEPLDKSHNKMINATRFGPTCYQFHSKTVLGDALLQQSKQAEDCLTLDVYVPNHRTSKLLPVFVWSYGGAFGEGGSSVPLYNPAQFVANNKDIIVVTWNYRLNVFGFPNSPALRHQNLGIRDQRAALEWLRDNIAGFGGDPRRITLGGQSAGADSGNALMYLYPDDPIVAAIAPQSGTVQVIGAATENVDSEFIRIAASVGCRNATDRHRELDCMRRVDANQLHRAISNSTFNTFGSPPGGSPMVDNVTLFTMEEYARRGGSGRFARVPTLIGAMSNEGDSVLNWSPGCGVNKTLSDLVTDLVFDCNIATEARFRHLYGVPVWRYRNQGLFADISPYPWLRPFHLADVPLLMGTYDLLLTDGTSASKETVAASHFLQKMFAAFVRNPASGLRATFNWPTYNPEKPTLVKLFVNETISGTLGDSAVYDGICKSPPPFDWAAVLKPPPSC